MKKLFFLFLGLLIFSSCKNYQNFTIVKPIISEINLKGNKIISEGEIRSNINSLNTSYKRFFPAKYYLYLANKRKIKDSLNKNLNLRFFKNPNPEFDSSFLTSIQKKYSFLAD